MNNIPQEFRIRIFPHLSLTPFALAEAEVQSREFAESKAVAAKKTIRSADANAAGLQEARAHSRIETRVQIETEIHMFAAVNSTVRELGALLGYHKRK